ncbi:Mannose-6-phosphate isomerase [Halotydeus destructor]|nr:Mannose-6-phosphate isomerase [Halotydeus destructor]
MLSLKCPAKNYHWGVKGSDSLVAKLVSKWEPIDENEPYAELWMGTHPSGSCLVTGSEDEELDGKPLSTVLSDFPEYAGTIKMVAKYGKDLPFLLKVLSVAEPLSIQSHPNKELAEKLRANQPNHYPDANHKPELAIALTKFQALCSFRTHSEILENLKQFPEFKNVVGPEAAEAYLKAKSDEDRTLHLKQCFSNLMNADSNVIAENLRSLSNSCKEGQDKELIEVFKRVHSRYPDDVGCFCLFFLNIVNLNPGEAIYLPANEPHAYLSGDCIECMAKSDNVIRAGLTPKFKDVATLCSSLSYSTKSLKDIVMEPGFKDGAISSYCPPIDEFAVDIISIPEAKNICEEFTLDARDSGSILIVIKGSLSTALKNLEQSSVVFIPAKLTVPAMVSGSVLAFRAYARDSAM